MSWDVLHDDDGKPGLVLRTDRLRDPLGLKVFVELAGPRILILAEVVYLLRKSAAHPAISLDGDVLTIDGANRRVVYRITGKDPVRYAFAAEWPD